MNREWTNPEISTVRIGLIAGLHTEAAVRYLRQLDEQFSNSFAANVPVNLITSSVNGPAFETAMKQRNAARARGMCLEAAQQCAAAGAEILMLGNSQLLVGEDTVRASVPVPLLDLPEATLGIATTAGIRRIALLGLRFAEERAVWEERCEKMGLMAHVPPADAAEWVNETVTTELSRGFVNGTSKATLIRLCADLRRDGARAVVLVAPELGLALAEEDSALPVLDVTTAHVTAAVRWVLEKCVHAETDVVQRPQRRRERFAEKSAN